MSTEIISLFDKWNNALATCRPEEVLKNYADDAVLVPTLSNKICTNKDSMAEYFKHFLLNKPKGKINQGIVKEYGDIVIHSGIYTFYFDRPEGPNEVMARFSFSYRKSGDEWLIIEHHSSLMPETVPTSETTH